MKRVEKGRIEEIRLIADNLARIKIELPRIAGEAKPGNFVTILPPLESGKYLRRPFSVAGISGECIELIVKNIGPVTGALLHLEAGVETDVLGPLGNSYNIEAEKIWMIGGGTGMASLLFLNSARRSGGVSGDRLLWAGRSASMIPSPDVLSDKDFTGIFKGPVELATDDGSAGEKGSAPEVLEKWLSREAEGRPSAIAACGPHGMMKAIKDVADRAGIPSWFSLEEFMACGSGACAGCAVPASAGGYLKACEDGPVFSGREVLL